MVSLSFRDCLKKIIEDWKLSAWSKAQRLRGVEFDDESIEDYWDPKPEKCIGYPFAVYITDKRCESEDAHWWVCLGRDYNSKGELEKTIWLQYCDECYRNLNESSANANK